MLLLGTYEVQFSFISRSQDNFISKFNISKTKSYFLSLQMCYFLVTTVEKSSKLIDLEIAISQNSCVFVQLRLCLFILQNKMLPFTPVLVQNSLVHNL